MFDAYYMSLAPNQTELREKQTSVITKLKLLATELKTSPYFNGKQLSMVDIAFAPILKRLQCLHDLFGLDLLNAFPKVRNWTNAILAVEAVQQGFHPEFDKQLIELLALKGSCLNANF